MKLSRFAPSENDCYRICLNMLRCMSLQLALLGPCDRAFSRAALWAKAATSGFDPERTVPAMTSPAWGRSEGDK
jgi:hypothetical protein